MADLEFSEGFWRFRYFGVFCDFGVEYTVVRYDILTAFGGYSLNEKIEKTPYMCKAFEG